MERDQLAWLITRVHLRGWVNLAEFDPDDTWSWKRLQWAIEQEKAERAIALSKMDHDYWLAAAGYQWVADPSNILGNAQNAMKETLRNVYPWRKQELAADENQAIEEKMVKSYQEEFGKPGEPRYEMMLTAVRRSMRKQTPEEKEAARQARRARKEAEQLGK